MKGHLFKYEREVEFAKEKIGNSLLLIDTFFDFGGEIMNREDESLRKMFFKFICKVAFFARTDYLRHQTYRNKHEIISDDMCGNVKQMMLAADDIQDHEDRMLLIYYTKNLEIEERQIVVLNIIEGRSIHEIAILFGKSERWIRIIKARALQKLRLQIGKEVTDGEF